jgi:hypothetical protein
MMRFSLVAFLVYSVGAADVPCKDSECNNIHETNLLQRKVMMKELTTRNADCDLYLPNKHSRGPHGSGGWIIQHRGYTLDQCMAMAKRNSWKGFNYMKDSSHTHDGQLLCGEIPGNLHPETEVAWNENNDGWDVYTCVYNFDYNLKLQMNENCLGMKTEYANGDYTKSSDTCTTNALGMNVIFTCDTSNWRIIETVYTDATCAVPDGQTYVLKQGCNDMGGWALNMQWSGWCMEPDSEDMSPATGFPKTNGGYDYRGSQSLTRTGRVCQRWSSQSPHTHDKTGADGSNTHPPPDAYKGYGFGDESWSANNHCRNPDGEPTIWCYTTDPDTRHERCNPL